VRRVLQLNFGFYGSALPRNVMLGHVSLFLILD
jgi:hypothetical protein